MELKVESEDVHELLKSHKIESNTEETQHQQKEQQKTLADDHVMQGRVDDVRESAPCYLIKET